MNINRKKFSSLAINNTKDLVFGRCKHPVTCGNNLIEGDGHLTSNERGIAAIAARFIWRTFSYWNRMDFDLDVRFA